MKRKNARTEFGTVVMRHDILKWWVAPDWHDSLVLDEKPFVSEGQVELELVVEGWERIGDTWRGALTDATLFRVRRETVG